MDVQNLTVHELTELRSDARAMFRIYPVATAVLFGLGVLVGLIVTAIV